jgi:hypothetical protein
LKRRQCGRFASQNLAAAYLRAGRYDEAKAIVEKAKAQGLYQPIGDIVLLQIAFIRGDHAAMDKLLRDYAGNGFETTMISIAAVSEAALGKVKSFKASNARVVRLAQQITKRSWPRRPVSGKPVPKQKWDLTPNKPRLKSNGEHRLRTTWIRRPELPWLGRSWAILAAHSNS